MVNNMGREITVMSNKLTQVVTDIGWIRKELEGNGKEGLIKATQKNTDFRVGTIASTKTLKFMFGSGWVLALLMIILNVAGII